MSGSFAATVGNGRILARIGRDGSLSGRAWKHKLDYVRGTNVLRVRSSHSHGTTVERRLAAIGESLLSAFRAEDGTEVGWDRGLEGVVPQAGVRVDGAWPEEFDPPPLAGATRASVVARVPDIVDRAAVTDLYARSILVLAQHHDRSGAFIASPGEDIVLAEALNACGERGAARAFFEWAASRAHAPPPQRPAAGTSATLRNAWQDAASGRRDDALVGLHRAVLNRSSVGLFLISGTVDLLAHAYLLLAVHALLPPVTGSDDGFFEHQATIQKTRHARALYGGAFHAGMPEPGVPHLVAEVRTDLDVSAVTLDVPGRPAEQFEALPEQAGRPARWRGPLPEVAAGEVSRYRISVQLSAPDATPLWASDSDPRPGGQEFAFEPAPPPPPKWVCNVLWLSPVHQSPSHHGYDHEDFLTVEPRYGGDEALVRLVEAAHGRGMRVLLDFVPNHTGRGHHLFRDAIEKDGDAAGYYRFWQWPHYYRCFSDVISLPELDTGDQNVQQVLVRAAQHWLTAYGVDGVRCDHVAGVDPALWVELRRGLRAVKADALVLGEATGLPDWLARYAGRLDAIFDFDLAYYVRQALARGRMDAAGFATWLDEHDHAYPGLALATLMDNHDMNRFLWMAGGNADRLKLAATLLLTLPGMPVIYYGTEVGLSQRFDGVIENAEARLPMLWGGDQNLDLLAHFQELGRMRRDSAALRRGDRRTVLADAEVFA